MWLYTKSDMPWTHKYSNIYDIKTDFFHISRRDFRGNKGREFQIQKNDTKKQYSVCYRITCTGIFLFQSRWPTVAWSETDSPNGVTIVGMQFFSEIVSISSSEDSNWASRCWKASTTRLCIVFLVVIECWCDFWVLWSLVYVGWRIPPSIRIKWLHQQLVDLLVRLIVTVLHC